MFKKTIFFILTCLCIAAIFLFSEQVAVTSDSLSRGITEKLLIWLTDYRELTVDQQMAELVSFNELVRSFAHFGVFLVLGVCSYGFFVSVKVRRPELIAMILCGAYAIFDEVHQEFFTDGRAFELVDLAKDWSGGALGILIAWLLYHCFNNRLGN